MLIFLFKVVTAVLDFLNVEYALLGIKENPLNIFSRHSWYLKSNIVNKRIICKHFVYIIKVFLLIFIFYSVTYSDPTIYQDIE